MIQPVDYSCSYVLSSDNVSMNPEWIYSSSTHVLRKILEEKYFKFVFEFEKQEHSKNDGTLGTFQSNEYTLKLSEAIITGDKCELCTCIKSPGPLGVALREKRHKRGLRQLYRSYNPPLTTWEKELRRWQLHTNLSGSINLTCCKKVFVETKIALDR